MAPHGRLVERLHAELKGTDQGGRQLGAGPRGRVRVSLALLRWRPVPDLVPPRPGRRRARGDPRRDACSPRARAISACARSTSARTASLLAYTTDEDGSERFRLHLKDLASGEELADLVANTSGYLEWAEDGRTLLYVELNDQLRPYRVRAHRLGDDPADDAVLYEEADPAFFVSIGKTRSRRFVLIAPGTHVTREIQLLDAADPLAPPRLVAPRRDGHRYSARPCAWPALDPDQRPARELPAGQRARSGARRGPLARGVRRRRSPLPAGGELLRATSWC